MASELDLLSLFRIPETTPASPSLAGSSDPVPSPSGTKADSALWSSASVPRRAADRTSPTRRRGGRARKIREDLTFSEQRRTIAGRGQPLLSPFLLRHSHFVQSPGAPKLP